jgi:isocitrate lyase
MSTTATETMTGVAPPATQNRWPMPGARWKDVIRPYTREEVERLRGTVKIEYTLARLGAERLWKLLHEEDYVPTLGAMTGNQAVQQVHAGLKAIYLSGWQVAADANLVGQMYPDQSLYPANRVPAVVKRINNALLRADQVRHQEGRHHIHWLAPAPCSPSYRKPSLPRRLMDTPRPGINARSVPGISMR